mgnify:CR=1 FL=1
MRSLQRDWREIHYAVPEGTEPIVDEYGNDTLEVRALYGSPTLLRVNVSANAGEAAVNIFGSQMEYSRAIRRELSAGGGSQDLVRCPHRWAA